VVTAPSMAPKGSVRAAGVLLPVLFRVARIVILI
jgi:hypothetical protein